jgi:predicted molibdopterin-dependent oxidoreductase YjgC
MVRVNIDDKNYDAEEGATILEVLVKNAIDIPTLCFHPSLKPSGSCKLCAVEVPGRSSGRPMTMLACILKVKDGLTVKTRGELVDRARTKAFRNLLQMAPQSRRLVELARKYDIDPGVPPDGCVRCRLCIRVCKEIVGPGALKMEKREQQNFVVPVEGLCIGCGTCANICPTDVIRVEDRDGVRTISIRDEIIGRHPLERCEGCGRYFATPKFLDTVHTRTSGHADTKSHHRYCPTCAKLFSDRIQSLQNRSRR